MIVPANPPYFLNFASISPIVLETLRLPGEIRVWLKILIPLSRSDLEGQLYLYSFPPFRMIRIFSYGSSGLWSFVIWLKNYWFRRRALQSPVFATNSFFWWIKQATAHEPLVSRLLCFSHRLKNCFSRERKVYDNAYEGLANRFRFIDRFR